MAHVCFIQIASIFNLIGEINLQYLPKNRDLVDVERT